MEKGNSSNKRPSPSDTSGKDRKRVRVQQARSIQTQGSPSTPQGPLNAVRSVDIVGFAEARAFEINAMHSAMKNSKNSAVQRAFQSLPRNLRRRAASHNIKRLPVRLRDRAMREVEADPVKKGKKPDNRYKKRRVGTISQEYLRRQGSKRWLETHIWHAKRMKMIEIWGYKLPEHSNENGIKSAYRSSHHQCIIQDTSYYGCLEIVGPKNVISSVFDHILDPTMPSLSSSRYITGKRVFDAYLYEYGCFPRNLIAPARFLWRQRGVEDNDSGMEVDELSTQGQLWVWIHPSAFEQAKLKIQDAFLNAEKSDKVQVNDLENSLVMFDFTGPRSTALLQAVLEPSKSNAALSYKEAHKTWDIISGLRTSSSLPPGIVLGLLVEDPRLTFPHKPELRQSSIPTNQSRDIQEIITNWPSTVGRSSIWESLERDQLLSSIIPEAKLNERRSQNLVPGTKLTPTESDSRIPVLLIQREGQPQIQRAPGGGSSEYECGWTLVLPKGWGMPFWKSLIFAGARPGGIRERRSFHFETRQSCFPYDFPTTTAYGSYAGEYMKDAQAKYDRKPVAKRINYSKMGVEDPFGASWAKVLRNGSNILNDNNNPTANSSEVSEQGLWLLQSPKLITALKESSQAAGETPLDDKHPKLTVDSLNQDIVGCLNGVLKSPQANFEGTPLHVEGALVRVGVEFLNRGTIGMNGMLYVIPEKQYKEWAALAQLKGKRSVEGHLRKEKRAAKSWMDSDTDDDNMEEDDIDLDDLEMQMPPPETLIGYVTTGQYCYSEGKSYGIGCCSATGLAHVMATELRQKNELQEEAKASGKPFPKVPKLMVLVRSVRSRASRLAKLTILS